MNCTDSEHTQQTDLTDEGWHFSGYQSSGSYRFACGFGDAEKNLLLSYNMQFQRYFRY